MPEKIHHNEIKRIATSFYYAFAEVDLSDAPGFLPSFPEGCCNWASRILGHFLKFERCTDALEILANRDGTEETDNHSWLEVDGMTIDLTCNQYTDCQHIIIEESSEWHAAWNIQSTLEIRHISDWDQPFHDRKVKPSDVYERLASVVRKTI